jgi:hypothetical protein
MADTLFVSKLTNIASTWLNTVNKFIYQGQNPVYVTSTNSGNNYTITLPAGSLFSSSSVVAGAQFTFKVNAKNTAAATLTVVGSDAFGPKNIYFNGGGLSGSEMGGGAIVTVVYDGVQWNLLPNSAMVYTVISIAALRNVSKTTYNSVYVLGYNAANDGGGGYYYYDSADTTSSDNGGSSIVAADGGRWKLVGHDSYSVLAFGADPTGATDSTAAIQAAITAAVSQRFYVRVPYGTYKIVPATVKTDEAGTNLCAFSMVSNIDIRAETGATFKISNNVSTDASPVRMSMFFSNQFLSNIKIDNLIMDMNGANNKISPSRPTSYSVFTQAHFIFSGTPGGVAAGGTDIYLTRCSFINTAGTTCIGMAQSNTVGVTLGKRWIIRDCLFNNNGLDTNDHSSIYGYVEDVLIEGNIFTSDTMYPVTGKAGALVAYEVHGANTRFIGNKVSNYFQGMWVSSNLTSDVDNIIISNNTFSPISWAGIDFYREAANESLIKKVLITGNTIGLDDSTYSGSPTRKVGIQINSSRSISDVQIIGNIASKIGTVVGSAFFSFGVQSVASQKHSGVVVRDNYTTGFVTGVDMVTNATNGLGYVEISGNSFKDNVPANTVFTTSIGISLAGASAVDNLNISNNTFVKTSGTYHYGIYLSGSVTNLYIGTNSYRGQATAGYAEAGFTATNRDGFFDNIAWTPTLNGWDNVGSPTFTGTTWSRFGKTYFINIIIQAGTSISATLLTSTITGLPANPLNPVIASCAFINSGTALNNCIVTAGGIIYPPTTGVSTGQLGISFSYTVG